MARVLRCPPDQPPPPLKISPAIGCSDHAAASDVICPTLFTVVDVDNAYDAVERSCWKGAKMLEIADSQRKSQGRRARMLNDSRQIMEEKDDE